MCLVQGTFSMEKQKRWHLIIIIAVLAWTLYNIFPTMIYYSKPLSKPIDKEGALKIEGTISQRINDLAENDKKWLESFFKLIGVHATKITYDDKDPSALTCTVSSPEEAHRVERFLPRAGANIPEKASQLYLGSVDGNTIQVFRRLGVTISPKETQKFFSYIEKRGKDSAVTDAYYNLIKDRFLQVAAKAGGVSEASKRVTQALKGHDRQLLDELATQISELCTSLSHHPTLKTRFLQNFFQTKVS